MRLTSSQLVIGLTSALILAACGGGGGGSASSGGTPVATANSSASISSGTVTAFGSIFVNGHEYDTSAASVVDDDAGGSTSSALAVGMTVEVKPTSASTNTAPKAQEIRVTPLARGSVDASDTSNSALSVMGQTVQLTPATVIKDARACVATATCTPAVITDQSGLVPACSLSAGTYSCTGTAATQVQVFGFLNASGSSSAITATLVRVIDNNGSGSQFYRATGALSVASSGTAPASYTLNGLSFSSQTACGAPIECSFSSGNVVTTRGTMAPTYGTPGSSLPIPVVFTPVTLHLSRASALTVGSTIEVEGLVSNASGSTFQVQGVTVTLGSGQTLPNNGDHIEATGTVTATAPPAITATSLSTEEHRGQHVSGFLLEDTLGTGPVTTNSPVTTPPTYTLSILGVSVQVNAKTHLEDETATTPPAFNINTFASYIGSTAPHVVVRGYIDTTGSSPVLVAADLRIVKAPTASPSYNARIGGAVTSVTSTSVTVDSITLPLAGVTVTDPAGATKALAVGDYIRIKLNDTAGALTVVGNVIDFGQGRAEHGGD